MDEQYSKSEIDSFRQSDKSQQVAANESLFIAIRNMQAEHKKSHEEMRQTLKDMDNKLDPVYDAYNTSGVVVKWSMRTVAGIVLVLTGLAAWLQIIGKHQ